LKLSLQKLTKHFGGPHVLDNIDAEIGPVRSLVLVGPSGGGKSTLLRLIAGLERPDAGSLHLDGHPLPTDEPALLAYRRSLGVVFQAFNLFPHLSALENITLPLEKVHGHPPAEAREIALQTLARFQLDAHSSKKPAALSGGQKQRVAIARAIACKPRLLLFDEPTSALDPEMTAEVLDLIGELKADGREFILVTHAMHFARHVADQVAFLAQGRILELAPPDRFFHAPEHPLCRDFLARVLRY